MSRQRVAIERLTTAARSMEAAKDELVDALLEGRAAGLSNAAMAEESGMSQDSVRRLLGSMDELPNPETWDDVLDEALTALAEAGLPAALQAYGPGVLRPVKARRLLFQAKQLAPTKSVDDVIVLGVKVAKQILPGGR